MYGQGGLPFRDQRTKHHQVGRPHHDTVPGLWRHSQKTKAEKLVQVLGWKAGLWQHIIRFWKLTDSCRLA